MSYHVNVTIPNHRQEPGMVISRYHFDNRPEADRYAAQVAAHPTGSYAGEVEPCGGCEDIILPA